MMPHTKVARKGYLWPYSLTSSWTGTNWDNDDAARRHVARYRTRSVWLTPWIQTTVKTSGWSRTYICRLYCVAYVFTKELRILW
jgi:hypothetical protein